jgi:hypothetical protein
LPQCHPQLRRMASGLRPWAFNLWVRLSASLPWQ